jgi:integral membrane protein (TIGR01906 family)
MDKNKLLLIAFCIFLPITLLLLSFKAVIFLYDFNPTQQNAVDFLYNKAELQEGYSENEISHMHDVKEVMKWMNAPFLISLLVMTLIFTYQKKNKQQIKLFLKYGGITTISFIGLILLFVLLSWNFIFTLFHDIFFPQGNWQFPSESLLITTFPNSFFVNISITIFIATLVLGSIFILLSKYKKT